MPSPERPVPDPPVPDTRGVSGDRWRPPAATGPVRAVVTVPGSKSMTNRALILAALADSPTLVTGPMVARDTQLMAAALRALGCQIDEQPAGSPGAWLLSPGRLASQAVQVDVGNAGTVMRFLPAVAALTTADVRFTGDPRAGQRPVRPLLDALRELGAQISDSGQDALPFLIRGRGSIPGGRVILDASGSSQFISGLLLAAPRYGKGAEIIHEGPRLPSLPHIQMTVAMLRAAGADVQTGSRDGSAGRGDEATEAWRVHPGALRPCTIAIEPDLSGAVPFLAAALVTGGEVTIAGWPASTTQPAGRVLDVLTAMGATASLGSEGLRVTGTGEIRGITADLGDIGELAPVLTALAALAGSPSVLTGIGHLRGHETDRLTALATEIGALGGEITERPDGLEITPRPLRAARPDADSPGTGRPDADSPGTGRPDADSPGTGGTVFDSHDDHRMVMAAAVLGLAVPGLIVQGAATVGKTFPGFPAQWRAMLEQSR